MRKLLAGGTALTILGGALIFGCVAPREETAHGIQAQQAFADLAGILDKIGEKPSGFRGDPSVEQPCDITNHDTCLIHVNIIQTYKSATGGPAFGCIIKVNDVSINSSDVTHIKWKLFLLQSDTDPDSAGTPVLSSTPYIFYKGFEILPVRDDEKQIKTRTSNKDGTVSAPYSYKKGLKLKYYPVVVQNPDPDDGKGQGNEVLCGSLDPKIVNN